ncbi:hypothetical protein [Halocatena pleomorpha]|uniref:Uncharacterized protein n=1 Tax=Halocatena pleomorpha TaxID=1785090 RepID=A0A3P3R6Y9_9EURY|nr:hypothetical protein [Halocatena pleomorpha]RRJ29231.1 hypothetical protein EIK79_13940 [Halocatena pleomorpha]
MSLFMLPDHLLNKRRGIEIFSIVVFGYALIRGQFLLGMVAVGGVWLVYFLWRLLFAVETIADALQRIARHQAEN